MKDKDSTRLQDALRILQAEIGEWHREQFPDVPLEAIERKLVSEIEEYRYARVMYLARRTARNLAALKAEAADVLTVILADMERLPSPPGMGGDARVDFAAGLVAKWAEVRERDYRGQP